MATPSNSAKRSQLPQRLGQKRAPCPPQACDPYPIPRVALDQGGVFTAQQALSEGWSLRQVRRRLEAGRWDYVAGKGLAAAGAEWTAYQLAMAAQLTFPSAVTSHLTAAQLYGWPLETRDGDPPLAMSHVTTSRVHRQPRGMIVHRLQLTGDEVVTVDGAVMVTAPERTAIDCLSVLSRGTALNLWAWIRTRQILDEQKLAQLITDRTSWAGTTSLRRLLGTVANGAMSAAELECHRLLRAAGITGWSAGVTLSDQLGIIGVVDILFHAQRLVIEIDGFAAHSSRTAFITDRQRQNRLVAAGFTVLRFTWDELMNNPRGVLRQNQNAL